MKKYLLLLPMTKKIFDLMFDLKLKDIPPVLNHYNVSSHELHDMLWEEFNISGMEIRIANTAFDYLIDCCNEEKELEDTLRAQIKKMILMSGIFYTNVAPAAVHPSEFVPK